MYRYKGISPDEKFDKCDNALDLINKIGNGEIKLADVKNDQEISKLHIVEIRKGSNKKKKKKKVKTAKKQNKKYWNALQIKKRGY